MTFIQKYGFILMIFVISTAFTIIGILKESKSASNTFVEVTIAEGDTLWGLAREYSGKDQPQKWIEKVMAMNELHSTTIRTGETLKLPEIETVMPDQMLTELAGED